MRENRSLVRCIAKPGHAVTGRLQQVLVRSGGATGEPAVRLSGHCGDGPKPTLCTCPQVCSRRGLTPLNATRPYARDPSFPPFPDLNWDFVTRQLRRSGHAHPVQQRIRLAVNRCAQDRPMFCGLPPRGAGNAPWELCSGLSLCAGLGLLVRRQTLLSFRNSSSLAAVRSASGNHRIRGPRCSRPDQHRGWRNPAQTRSLRSI